MSTAAFIWRQRVLRVVHDRVQDVRWVILPKVGTAIKYLLSGGLTGSEQCTAHAFRSRYVLCEAIACYLHSLFPALLCMQVKGCCSLPIRQAIISCDNSLLALTSR